MYFMSLKKIKSRVANAPPRNDTFGALQNLNMYYGGDNPKGNIIPQQEKIVG